MDKARQATFNALGSLGLVAGARMADCFAGTGALGIEALSRGAAHVTFVERERAMLDVLQRNLATLGITDRATVLRGDARVQVRALRDVDVVLADPPYDFEDWAAFLAAVPCGFVVAESDREIAAPAGWAAVRARRYGRAWVTFLRRLGGTAGGSAGDTAADTSGGMAGGGTVR
jgi:16S rRNA (guanine966-N2)-methyltransferase